jgi:hypothetical protein
MEDGLAAQGTLLLWQHCSVQGRRGGWTQDASVTKGCLGVTPGDTPGSPIQQERAHFTLTPLIFFCCCCLQPPPQQPQQQVLQCPRMTVFPRYCQEQQRRREAGIREMVDWYELFVVAVQWCDHPCC